MHLGHTGLFVRGTEHFLPYSESVLLVLGALVELEVEFYGLIRRGTFEGDLSLSLLDELGDEVESVGSVVE